MSELSFDEALDRLLVATPERISNPRWVAARSARGWVEHAVWVTHDTEPGQSRPGASICGAAIPYVIAGPNGGHDWDRTETRKQCIHCRRELRRAANAPARP